MKYCVGDELKCIKSSNHTFITKGKWYTIILVINTSSFSYITVMSDNGNESAFELEIVDNYFKSTDYELDFKVL